MVAVRLPGELDSLGAVRDFVREAAAEAGLERKPTYRLALAVDEVATNVITHGYHEAGVVGELVLSAAIRDDALAVTLEDSAAPYDPLAHQVPGEEDLSAPLEGRPVGGLGIMLALRGVDGFEYASREGANYSTFIVRRGTASPPGGE